MSAQKKHIIIVSSEFPPQPGGIGNHAFNLALYLSFQKHKVTVIADQRSVAGEEERQFDDNQPFDVLRIKLTNPRFVMYFKRIIRTNRTLKKGDFVIATGKFSLWNIAALSYFHKVKTLAVIHGSEVNFKSVLLRKSIDFALKRMDRIVAVSNYTNDLIAHLDLNAHVIPNGINLNEWSTNNLSELKLKGQPIITTVGRVSSRKGQLNVIKQLPELIHKFPDIHYHCVGIPTEADDFLSVAKQLNVASHITFHGSVNHKTLKEILYATDVFVMLSSESKTGDVEGFGIAILEANALGIPSIGSKGCGIEDAINNKSSGVLIELDNSEEFINGLDLISSDKTKYKTEAKKWAEAHDWSIIVNQYMKLLD